MIYFTSDLHLGYENILWFSNRSFGDVGVDANSFYPVAITTILDFIDMK